MDSNLQGTKLTPFPKADQAKGVPFSATQLVPKYTHEGDFILRFERVTNRIIEIAAQHAEGEELRKIGIICRLAIIQQINQTDNLGYKWLNQYNLSLPASIQSLIHGIGTIQQASGIMKMVNAPYVVEYLLTQIAKDMRVIGNSPTRRLSEFYHIIDGRGRIEGYAVNQIDQNQQPLPNIYDNLVFVKDKSKVAEGLSYPGVVTDYHEQIVLGGQQYLLRSFQNLQHEIASQGPNFVQEDQAAYQAFTIPLNLIIGSLKGSWQDYIPVLTISECNKALLPIWKVKPFVPTTTGSNSQMVTLNEGHHMVSAKLLNDVDTHRAYIADYCSVVFLTGYNVCTQGKYNAFQ